jgi:ferritin
MIAFKDLGEVLKITLKWEHKLKDFYDVAEYALKSTESKKTVQMLRDRLTQRLEILKGVDMKSFGKTEWIRYAPAYRDEDLIPIGKIRRDTAAAEIFDHLLDYESKLKNTYSSIANNLISRTQKDLFESLAAFKDEQIEEIRSLKASQLSEP